MFLTSKFNLIVLCGVLISAAIQSLAIAASPKATVIPLPGLESGNYRRIEGPKELCANFQITTRDLKASYLQLGARYQVILKNSRKQVESDLDPSCIFVEETQKELSSNESLVRRVNAEVCKGVPQTKVLSEYTFTPGQITLDHTITDNTRQAHYKCKWSTNP